MKKSVSLDDCCHSKPALQGQGPVFGCEKLDIHLHIIIIIIIIIIIRELY